MSKNQFAQGKSKNSSKPVDFTNSTEQQGEEVENVQDLPEGPTGVLPLLQRYSEKYSKQVPTKTKNLRPENILALQRAIGNQAVMRLISKGKKETKPLNKTGPVIQRFIENDTYVLNVNKKRRGTTITFAY